MAVSLEMYLLVQGGSSFCLLFALSHWAVRGPVPLGRLLLCALGSGVCQLTAAMFGNQLAGALMAVVMNLALPMLALCQLPRIRRVRTAAVFLLLNLALEGSARMLTALGLPALPAVALAAVGTLALPWLRGTGQPLPITRVEVRWRGRSLCLNALMDSGNLVRDGVTGLPVIVCSQQAMEILLPRFFPGTLPEGFRYLRVRTAAGGTLMPCFRPDCVRLLTPSGWRETAAVIGLSVSGYNGFQALVPLALAQPQPALSQERTASAVQSR